MKGEIEVRDSKVLEIREQLREQRERERTLWKVVYRKRGERAKYQLFHSYLMKRKVREKEIEKKEKKRHHRGPLLQGHAAKTIYEVKIMIFFLLHLLHQ